MILLCLTFDNFGRPRTIATLPLPNIVPRSEWDSYNAIGLSLGHPRILQLLDRLGIRTTFFAGGYSAVLHPAELRR